MALAKNSDHIQIKIKIPNPSQEYPASSKASNQDLKDMYILYTFKIKTGSQNSKHGYTKTINPIQTKMKMPNPSQEKFSILQIPNHDLKYLDVLCTFKIKIGS